MVKRVPLSELVSELRLLRWPNSFLSLNWASFDLPTFWSSSSFFSSTTCGSLSDSTLLHLGAACRYFRSDFMRLLLPTNSPRSFMTSKWGSSFFFSSTSISSSSSTTPLLSSSSSEKSENLKVWPISLRFSSFGKGSFLKFLAHSLFSE